MFCHKCGNKSLEGSAFCQKCGVKLIESTATPQASSAPAPTVTQKNEPKKKKSKKLYFSIAGIVVVAIIAIAIASLGGNGGGGQPDLFQVALRVSPMTEQGFDATYGDLFSWLMTDRRTNLDQQGDVAYLTFSGSVTGGDYPVSVVLIMTGLSPNAPNQRLIPHAMTLNGMAVHDFNNPDGVLSDLFWAHHNRDDYRTFMDFVNWDNEYAFGIFRNFVGGAGASATQPQVSGNDNQPTQDVDASATEWQTVTIPHMGVSINLPPTWTFIHQTGDEFGPSGALEIFGEGIDGPIHMMVWLVMVGDPYMLVEEFSSVQAFAFADGSRGYMLEDSIFDMPGIVWLNVDSYLGVTLHNDGNDRTHFTNNSEIIIEVVRSLRSTW